jgi:glycosyltransferase involved in cell wall biosynthesis
LSTTLRPADYQAFIARSRAEFSVAKHGYVVTHSGWFSDRSSGYLASGRPVILQDTGFSDFLPADEGLLAFRTLRDAQEAIKRVTDDPERHGKAARRLVEEFFDSALVLTDLLEAVL